MFECIVSCVMNGLVTWMVHDFRVNPAPQRQGEGSAFFKDNNPPNTITALEDPALRPRATASDEKFSFCLHRRCSRSSRGS